MILLTRIAPFCGDKPDVASSDSAGAPCASFQVEKILLDYSEDSMMTMYDLGKNEKNVYKGLEVRQVRHVAYTLAGRRRSGLTIPTISTLGEFDEVPVACC